MRYIWEKAAHVEVRNLAAPDWQSAATQMRLVSELNSRVQKPFYHMAVSWHEQEQPTDAQQIEAADYLLKALGLDDHQAVIAIHRDTAQAHFHIIVNTVHPQTGKVWSKSNDRLRVEKACREIELLQGWSHDRGRCDFDVAPDGAVTLKPASKANQKKQADRAKGKRAKTSGDRKFEKSAGFETFEHTLTDTLRDRFAAAASGATDWQSLHLRLQALGLRYGPHGSGTRVWLLGSTEFVKASALGARFSISKMKKRFGPYEPPCDAPEERPSQLPPPIASMTGAVSETDRKSVSASSFKLTLLRRIYCNIHLDPEVARQIKYVALDEVPPRITLQDTTTLLDHGPKVTTSHNTKEARAIMIAMAQAKGWSSVTFKGPADFVRAAALEAAEAGLTVTDVPEDIQAQCDDILKQRQALEPPIETLSRTAHRAALEAVADHDDVRAEKEKVRTAHGAARTAALKELEDVLEATHDRSDPVSRAVAYVARQEKRRLTPEGISPRGHSPAIPSKDADKAGSAKMRRIRRRLKRHEAAELARMKAVPIDVIATLGGWTLAPRPAAETRDPLGKQTRTYTRNSETIEATLKGALWVWTNSKTGAGGSVIDLWRADHPGSTLNEARDAFRAILDRLNAEQTPADEIPPEYASRHDHTEARRRWEEAPLVQDPRSFAEDKGISKGTLLRFRDAVRVGVDGALYFAHRHPETGGIQGFEQSAGQA
ncbi:MAG: relaxase/mobilization nuclease domain-containing protein, partial [Donghicola eburneus]